MGGGFRVRNCGPIPNITMIVIKIGGGKSINIENIASDLASQSEVGVGHGSTFAGNPLSCVAATEVIKEIKKNQLLSNATKIGDYFLNKLKELNHPAILSVKGKGLWIGIELKEQTTPYLKKMQDKGLIAASSSSDTIRFLPPINISKKEVDEALSIIKEVFS